MLDFAGHDPRFGRLVIGHAKREPLWSGGRWLEGPQYVTAGRYLLFSDIPNDRSLQFDETEGAVSTFREPARHANGHTTRSRGAPRQQRTSSMGYFTP
jgi:gluconolactonase